MARALGYQVRATPIPQPTLEARDLCSRKNVGTLLRMTSSHGEASNVLEVAYAPAPTFSRGYGESRERRR
jgi:hypothetical protein